MRTLNELFRLVILENELGGDLKYALRFSDPDGIRSGKSGWSFGVCQFDTQNNDQALACLAECGFSEDEIQGIVKQTINPKPLCSRLVDNAGIIAKYDEAQLSHCLDSAVNFNNEHEIPITDTSALLAQADYVNQYGSMGDGFAAFLKKLDHPVTASDILDFKLDHTKYGKNHPDDCKRRYNNLMKVVQRI
jgi:hypothetical protein